MKKQVTLLVFSAILYSFTGLNRAFAQEALQFTANQNNPALTHGDPGTYDGEFCVLPYPLWDNGTFYLFYTGNAGVCFATSTDGYDFTKFTGNPVLTASGSGFDSLGAAQAVVLKVGAKWVMYYNARQFPGWGPGESIGRATADSLTGAWDRSLAPMLTLGSAGEWDAGLITPNNVFPLASGGFIMFYYASTDFNGTWLMGMATSPDGINWTKYNDPATTQAPYAESDPILPAGESGEFDEWGVLGAGVFKKGGFYHMYYSGVGPGPGGYRTDIGFAFSADGITWQKWAENPVYVQEDDPYFNAITMIFEQPGVLLYNSTVFMYYDYGVQENSLGMATADCPIKISEWELSDYALRITNSPNPVTQSTTFSYNLEESGQVSLDIFDSFGRLIATPLNEWQPQGEKHILWDARKVPAGIYCLRLHCGKMEGKGKMLVVK